MADIVVSEKIQKEWAAILESFQASLNYELLLCSAPSRNIYQVVASAANSFDCLRHAIAIDKAAKQVLHQGDRYTLENAFPGYRYMLGLPVRWRSGAYYGVLIVLCRDVLPDAPQQQILLDSLISRIEKDLIAVYEQHQSRFQNELVQMINSYPAPEFQRFIDSFKDHIWVKNQEGIYTHCNQEVEKAWGKKRTEIVGKSDHDLFDSEVAERFEEADRQVLLAGTQLVVEECANEVSTKSKTWLETVKTPILDASGDTIGIIGMTRNVTNRKAIEDQLVVASTVFENSVEGVIITDPNGIILYVNQAFSEITGYEQPEVIGRNPKFLKSGRHGHDFYRDMWASLMSTGKWKGELWNRRKNGAIYPEYSTVSAVYNNKNEINNFVAVFSDISQQKEQEKDLLRMAYHDPLTDLPNRSRLADQIEQEIIHAKRHEGKFATVFIDVDHFKHVNDSYGHLIGDEVLCEVANRLKRVVREEDTISRIGGDEFVILLPGIRDVNAMTSIVQKLMSIFDFSFELNGAEAFRLTGSMGIALYPDDGNDSDVLLSNADAAMYRAKKTRNNFAFYTEALTKESESHLRLQVAMHDALEQGGFHLVYQPQIDMTTRKLTGFESLLRWNHPKLGFVSPMEFIPLAEKTGLIHEVGLWVLRRACQQGVVWRDAGYKFGRIAVNVSGHQLQDEGFVRDVLEVLRQTGLEPKYLELEVTEGFMLNNADVAIASLNRLRKEGIDISMDDFGTGYSSLSYLQQLPLNKLKIDRSFVMNLPNNTHDIAIADAIIALGNALSLKVVAEGVETEEQAQFLVHRGCSQAQGYLFSRPQLAEDLTPLLEKQRL